MTKNKIVKISIITLLIVLATVLVLIISKTNNSDSNNNNEDSVDKAEDDNFDNSEDDLNNDSNFDNNEEDLDEDDETQNFVTQLPTFNDAFEKAIFIYGWFYGAETLIPYIDRDNKIEESTDYMALTYNFLKIDKFKTIQDMKTYAYEVFDKSFIDAKFNERTTGDMKIFKENKDGVWIFLNAPQYSYDTGYTNYNKVINDDGSILYKVNIKAELMGEEYSCDTTYEYKMEKNNEGNFVFKTFESPIDICIKDANTN